MLIRLDGGTLAAAAMLAAAAVLLPACLSTDSDEPEQPEPLTEAERAEGRVRLQAAGKAYDLAVARSRAVSGPPEGEALDAVEQAASLCREWLDAYENEPGRADALGMLAVLCEISGDLEGAREAYEEILDNHPGSARFPEALDAEMRIARRYMAGEKTTFLGIRTGGGPSAGAEILEKLCDKAPFASFADEALYMLGDHRLEGGEYDEAVVDYETLLRRFPDSAWRLKAEYQSARCFYLKFVSLDYDLVPLEEALERFRTFIELHGEDQDEDARRLAGPEGAKKMTSLIEGLLAEKNYGLGNWYLNRGRPEAARSYYRVVVLEFPGTEWAGRAQAKLRDLEE